MKILLLGTDNFSASSLYFMLQKAYNVCAVVTHAKALHTDRLKHIAKQHNIPYYVVDNINSDNSYSLISRINPDIIFSIHFDRILQPKIINLANKYAINLHPSLLPKYRGMSPFQSVLKNGESETGITVHLMTEDVDDGNIIEQVKIPLNKDMFLADLYMTMMQHYPAIIESSLDKLIAGNFITYQQNRENISYYGKIKDDDYLISESDDIIHSYNKIRAFSKPDKGAKCGQYTIWFAEIIDKKINTRFDIIENEAGLYIYLYNGTLFSKKGSFQKHLKDTPNNIGGGLLVINDIYENIIIYKNILLGSYKFNTTNYYNDIIENEYDSSIFILIDKYCLLLHKYHDYCKLYYWADDINILSKFIIYCLKMVTLPVILEIAYKNCNNEVDIVERNTPFSYYGGLLRMQKRILQTDIVNITDENIMYACIDNIEEIKRIHANIFNKYVDRKLSDKELNELILNKNVLIYKINNKIAGCLIYSQRGKFYHLRYWFINKKSFGSIKGIGRALLYRFYQIVGVDNYIEVWSRKDNKFVTNIYKKYGFKEDGLNSDILVYTANSCIEPLRPLN